MVRRAAFVVAIGLISVSGTASAYPSSVVFAPTGEVRPFGSVGVFGYASYVLDKHYAPGVTWFGVEAGIVPKLDYAKDGPAFGGVEVGADLFSSDLQGTPDSFVKPVTNVKVQPLTEWHALPAVAFGVLGVAPFRSNRSMNMFYGSLSKSVKLGGTDFGKVTLGLARAATSRSDDPYGVDFPVFRASWPFDHSSHLALLGGYASPAFGKFSFAVDHVGGVSEVSSTNASLNFLVGEATTWALGGFMITDKAAYAAGAFTYLAVDFKPLG